MLRFIVFAAVLGLVGGLAGAFAFNELSGQADALALLATRVREQNLDASGLIRVHEQGTANVTGTVDVGNLPLDEAGNLRVSGQLAAPRGRLQLVAADLDLSYGTEVTTDFFDTWDCSSIALFAVGSDITRYLQPGFVVSMDGVNSTGNFSMGVISQAYSDRAMYVWDFPGPWLNFRFSWSNPDQAGHIDEAWLYCTP